jgi:hypothetical protein
MYILLWTKIIFDESDYMETGFSCQAKMIACL